MCTLYCLFGRACGMSAEVLRCRVLLGGQCIGERVIMMLTSVE